MVKELTIKGFRSFGKEETIHFSLPKDGKEGSGLTFIVGANNSGKTTIIEALEAFCGSKKPSFSKGKRNFLTDSIVSLSMKTDKNLEIHIQTVNKGSETIRDGNVTFYFVPSRRQMSSAFGNNELDRNSYINQYGGLKNQRTGYLDGFEWRIMRISKDRKKFDSLIEQILGYPFNWTVELADNSSYYIRCDSGENSFSSEGIGDGIWSVFVIAISLCDSYPGDTIVIDEPELSIHPYIQKRLLKVLVEYAKDRQIILATHSVYFIDWDSIINGANLVRVVKDEEECSNCYEIDDIFREKIDGFIKDKSNPHLLGNEAKEVFFLSDKMILVEGQEDVLIYQKIVRDLNINLNGDFFGWGVGGSSKMDFFLNAFKLLGYKYVYAIYDGDKKTEYENTSILFPSYDIHIISKDDIRDKIKDGHLVKSGLVDIDWNIKDENKSELIDLFYNINSYFC